MKSCEALASQQEYASEGAPIAEGSAYFVNGFKSLLHLGGPYPNRKSDAPVDVV
jgi:hypothetical protein